MCKALEQNVSEIGKSYRHKVCEIFKDAYSLTNFSL